jgi:anthranilate/para-aminobenzoate synthase component II
MRLARRVAQQNRQSWIGVCLGSQAGFKQARTRRSYTRTVSTEFLDRLASQLKIGKSAARRRAIERILDTIKKDYETGKYQSTTEAERDFRKRVESEESGN